MPAIPSLAMPTPMPAAGAEEEVVVWVEAWAAAGAEVGDSGAGVVVVVSAVDMPPMDLMAIHPIDALQG